MKIIASQIRIGLILSFFLLLISPSSFSQQFFGQSFQHIHDEKCAATHMEKLQEEQLGIYGSKEFFESWMNGQIKERKSRPQTRTTEDVKFIPVVVHIIHNGTPIGEGANISLAQIESQIRTLNEDFRRQNPDASQTPEEFLGVAADSRVEFVLAKQDPRGLPTDGINRVQGPKTTYSPNDAGLIGQLAQWPPEDYLNIWVVPLVNPFIGYATFPVSNLPGLNFPAAARETDGVTVDYRYFGQGGSAVGGSRGRTLTHEIGHFFGLRHIWGDGNCNADDFVDDTPNQDGPNNICRPTPRVTCGTRDMVENYMDYTTDVCMNIFTQGQVDRMDVVLANSPRRASLVNGRATIEPILQDNDLGVERLLNPQNFICELNIVPEVLIFNSGSNRITSARIEIRNNTNLLQSLNISLDLETGDNTIVTFNPVTLNNNSNNFEVNIVEVNGTTDPNPSNNSVTSTPVLQPELSLPYSLRIEDIGNTWVIDNPDNDITWETIPLTIGGSTQEVIRVQNYEYDAIGELDFLVSPQINLNQFPNAQLTFLMAHAPYNAQGFGDDLIIAISADCGNTFEIIDAPYSKDRVFLQTSEPTLNEFVPRNESQFRREIVNLAPFADLGNVRIAFINRNGFGNNIYIKDIEVLEEEFFKYDVQLTQLVSPTPISTGNHEVESILLKNTGNLPISGFVFRRTTSFTPRQSFLARGTVVPPGDSTLINLPISTREGVNQLIYRLEFPNFDQNPRNPIVLDRHVVIHQENIRSPWRQNFNNAVNLDPWVAINPENNLRGWALSPLQVGSSASNVVRIDPVAGMNTFWLGSPTFDLTRSSQAALFFDRAAGSVSPTTKLLVYASDDGGTNYREVFNKSGNDLVTVSSGDPNPNSSGDFTREYVNLSDFAGSNKSMVRVAIVLEGQEDTNSTIFLNNIELFLSANPEPVDPGLGSTIIYPNPANELFNIVFNLPRFETVKIQIVSATGTLVHDVDYPNTLNQTYTFSSRNFSKGLFIVQITSQSITETRKLIIY
ncbi:M43 family zinc metalloprotease [Cecembia lonarensis]|uniref:Zinc-dependent metalloproteinase lipoprotein, family n=1 Tax=Cecembia lonarensis (strain CCUG 58316 / KCTC 22772 / LW9) TaxID=1225176 RepID=K1L211_CECL9|nr:M43 family zinc metalloprotease [Cecembia lonarensis]EKB50460.1 zinc-dependent metalloproteinase lipoprotein, family [Cecembia lonarensis LW9]